jgi:hypothetical protein
MFGEQLTRKDRRDVVIAIERDIDREGDAGRPRDLADVLLDRVAVNHAPRRVWAADAFCIVHTSTVFRPTSPGATILAPPLNPAKKCGSTKPVVMRTSATSARTA